MGCGSTDWCNGSTEEGLGKSAMAHQGVADRRDVILLGPVGLHQDRIAEQVADADPEGGGEFAHNVEPSYVALVPLDFAPTSTGWRPSCGIYRARPALEELVEAGTVEPVRLVARHG
jgi:hypothetical protein